MGKKGKGNKLAKMSEEERARYLQLRADIEEEARRRKMQLISLYMKNKLKREDAFCRLNMAKINQEWRSILRQVKCQELRNDMLEVEKFFKEALDRKDRITQRLLHDMDVAEDMYATLQQSHMQTVCELIGTQQQRIQFFRKIYEDDKQSLLKEHQTDFNAFEDFRKSAQEQLECVMYQLEDKASMELKNNYERHLQRLDDMKSEMQLRLEGITRSGESKLERLWQEYQDVLSGYVRHTEGFYAEYIDLKERDEENTAIIRDHCYEIEKATDKLAHLKLVAADTTEKNDVKVNYLVKVKNDLSANLSELKQQVDDEISDDDKRFMLMSVESHEQLKDFEKKGLQKIATKGETLLQLATVCRKFETEREKILPLGLPPITGQAFENTGDHISETPPELKDHVFGNWRQMENFWKRANNASIDVVCLKQNKQSLESENARLKAKLQEYLVHLNISNGSNTHINDYLSKRPSSMHVDRVRQMDLEPKKKSHSAVGDGSRMRHMLRPLTAPYVEANFTNAVRSEQLIRGKPKLATIETRVNGEHVMKYHM